MKPEATASLGRQLALNHSSGRVWILPDLDQLQLCLLDQSMPLLHRPLFAPTFIMIKSDVVPIGCGELCMTWSIKRMRDSGAMTALMLERTLTQSRSFQSWMMRRSRYVREPSKRQQRPSNLVIQSFNTFDWQVHKEVDRHPLNVFQSLNFKLLPVLDHRRHIL